MKEGKLGWERREGGQCAGELVGGKGGRSKLLASLSLSLLPQIRAHTNASGRAEEETGVEKTFLNLFSQKIHFSHCFLKGIRKGMIDKKTER